MNMLTGTLRQGGTAPAVILADGTAIDLPGRDIPLPDGSKVTLGIRPEHATRSGPLAATVGALRC